MTLSSSVSTGPQARKPVAEVMSRRAALLSGGDTLASAGEKMRTLTTHSAIVTEGDVVIGLVDYANPDWDAARYGHDPGDIRVRECMHSHFTFCFEDDNCLDALRVMIQSRLQCLLVAAHDGNVVGIIELQEVAPIADSELHLSPIGAAEASDSDVTAHASPSQLPAPEPEAWRHRSPMDLHIQPERWQPGPRHVTQWQVMV